MKTVSELMTSEPRVCRTTDSLNIAAQLMWDNDCGCVPVVDDERRLVGMVTDRDACMAAYTQGRSLADIPVQGTMSSEVHACRPEDSLTTAEHAMQHHQVRRLPVVDADRHVVGILSLNDIARAGLAGTGRERDAVSRDDVAATLGAICERRLPALRAKPAGRAVRALAPQRESRAAEQG